VTGDDDGEVAGDRPLDFAMDVTTSLFSSVQPAFSMWLSDLSEAPQRLYHGENLRVECNDGTAHIVHQSGQLDASQVTRQSPYCTSVRRSTKHHLFTVLPYQLAQLTTRHPCEAAPCFYCLVSQKLRPQCEHG
jgi:hypothetical protein